MTLYIMVVNYLARESYKVLKLHMNSSSYFEISDYPF